MRKRPCGDPELDCLECRRVSLAVGKPAQLLVQHLNMICDIYSAHRMGEEELELDWLLVQRFGQVYAAHSERHLCNQRISCICSTSGKCLRHTVPRLSETFATRSADST